jgi:protein-(glutamine-N5) methyltransferase, release factor-specific
LEYRVYTNENVLIPRPDTLIVVEQALKLFKNKPDINFLDIGTGSGCIILSILKEKKKSTGIGIDLCKECIKLTKINAQKLKVENRIKLFKSNVDNFNFGKYDLIISNPPYIKKLDLKYLDKDVINFEPRLALNGGLDGLSEIRKVINKSSVLIKKNGKLILEIAYNQKKEVKRMLLKKGFFINKIVKDLAKNDRCIISTKKY